MVTKQEDRVDHVARTFLPWRSGPDKTECGRLITDDMNVITRAALIALARRVGPARAQLVTCLICYRTASQHKPWAEDPISAMAREIAQVRYRTPEYGYVQEGPADPSLRDELYAIAALIAEHRAEFDGYVAGLGQTASLAQARHARRRKAAGRPR